MKVKKGDQVKVISGNDKGKTGKVLSVIPHDNRIVVEAVNMKKKHVRPRKQGQKGEVVDIPAPFSISRVMIICPRCAKPSRMGYNINDSGKKARVCKKCGEES